MPLLSACASRPASATLRAVCFLVIGSIVSPLRGDGEPAARGEAAVAPRPGLLATCRSLLEPDASFSRIDLKPTFYLPEGSIHPRLPAGPFEAMWTGHIRIEDETAPIRLGAYVRGEVSVEIGGVTVLAGRGDDDRAWVEAGTPLEHEPGLYPLRIRYLSPAMPPARLQIWWEGPDFSREPVPPWRLFHRPEELTSASLEEDRIARGLAVTRDLGCARCHAGAFPGIHDPPPGPSLADLGRRVKPEWLLEWLDEPDGVRAGARMPSLFSGDRPGFVERWIIAQHLAGPPPASEDDAKKPGGDHRMGRREFVSLGCAACHFLPDADRAEQPDLGRLGLTGLGDRFTAEALAAFIADPAARYADGRMPKVPLSSETARNLAAFLLLWSKPAETRDQTAEAPSRGEIDAVAMRLGTREVSGTAIALIREKRCAACHPGIGDAGPASEPLDVPIGGLEAGGDARGCWSGRTTPRFRIDPTTMELLAAYATSAARERHPSPFEERRRLLERTGCVRCHQRDADRPPPLEEAGSLLGGAWLMSVPFQRAPRLTHVHQKLTREHLLSAVRDGVSGLRPGSYTYRMPAFGAVAGDFVRALAEADGEPPNAKELPAPAPADPTLASLAGPGLIGFQGYSCIACHVWKGKAFSSPDPGAIGPDLTRMAGRLRREWFDRFLEAPARSHPSTPMPAYFPRGRPTALRSILDGDVAKQKEALWSYLALGADAPSPTPPPPMVVEGPRDGEPAIVAQIPLRLPDGALIESICVLGAAHDIVVYDIGAGTLHGVYTGARLLRGVEGRIRTFTIDGARLELEPGAGGPPARGFRGHDRLIDGVRLRSTEFGSSETIRIVSQGGARRLVREHRSAGKETASSHALPPPREPAARDQAMFTDPARVEGTLERPGYRAVAFPRPKTRSGEDVVMPGAIAVDPRNGRVFVASMKGGEVFVLDDPTGDGKAARFVDYTRGLFQEAYSMLAEEDALYILHRRNLTRVRDLDGDGLADEFERIALLPQGIADAYDYGYGLVRDTKGALILSHAPHANRHIPGSGGVLRLAPASDAPAEPIAFGLRNPLGWCTGPGGEVFFTDNQGEWVAANKLCHVVEGRFYGCPNSAQKEHAAKPAGKTAVWVPYAWAKSVNGVAYDSTGGKFGPFPDQFFLAELMFGGAIVRASLEKVNGEYQGACFPFWGKGLLGPVVLAFDPAGRLFVGSITEPGWMSQPDRGALFRLDFTGEVPFEMQTIRVLHGGFRILFTAPAALEPARVAASYRVERYRYEYTGAYGSPELDRTDVPVDRIEAPADGLRVDLFTGALLKDHVYRITAHGVRSTEGKPLVHPTGAYTVNEVP